MAPVADAVVDRRLPGDVVDHAPSVTELKRETTGGQGVEAEHPVVGMTAQGLDDPVTGPDGAVVRQADLIDFSLASCLARDGRAQEARTVLSITRPRALARDLVAGL